MSLSDKRKKIIMFSNTNDMYWKGFAAGFNEALNKCNEQDKKAVKELKERTVTYPTHKIIDEIFGKENE